MRSDLDTTLLHTTETVAYFVYGTLRPASGGWGEGVNGYPAEPVPATATGALYDYGGAFPYADFDGEGTIQGDIITVSPEMARAIARTEVGALYTAREVVAQTAEGSRVVYGWQIDRPTKGLTLIPSGDWLVCEKRYRQRHFARR